MILQPQKTCALVVGIASYGLGKDWDLPGAKVAADSMLEWLVQQGLDRNRIYHLPDAKGDDIRKALTHLRDEQQDCNNLILYWAGHGFETETAVKMLFVADAFQYAPKAFEIDQIILYLRKEAPQFAHVLGIFDACATGRSRTDAIPENLLMNDKFQVEARDWKFLFAAASATETDYPDDQKPSRFTQRLMELLKTSGMTVAALVAALRPDYPVDDRDGRSPYWSGGDVQRTAWAIEAEVMRIGNLFQLDDARWRAEARRLDSTLDAPDADFRAIVQKIAGWDRSLGARTAVALLLRGAKLTGTDVTAEIRSSKLLAPSYDSAAAQVANLRAFENPSYLIKTDYRPDNELGVTGVWFLSGADRCEPQRLLEAVPADSIEKAIQAVADHMYENDISSESMIHLVAPLRVLLDPQDDILKSEKIYPLVFRERKRSEGLELFRPLRPKFRDRQRDVKRRAALGFQLDWFEATETQKWATVEFPALRTGNCTNAEAGVERLLETLTPFAAITRVSIRSLGEVNEAELREAIGDEKEFAKIPIRVQKGRENAGSFLRHLTIIWDDRELHQGYFH